MTANKKFLKIKCSRCKTLHLTFHKATTYLKCNKCNKLLVKPKGGKAKVKVQIKEVTSHD